MGRANILTAIKGTVAGSALLLIAACDDAGKFDLKSVLKPAEKPAEEEPVQAEGGIERDVEAPDVFQVSEAGLWDGRPSLGGVWVAHPDVADPERVMIRNTANGKSVVGALFRREREIPGPRLQASSDAAAALGMLAGAPVQLSVTALRREVVPVAPVIDETPVETDLVEVPEEITESSLDPIASAAAAIEASETPVASAAPAEQPAAKPAPKQKSSLSKPYLQIGIFNVKANADRTAAQMRSAGMVPTVKEQEANGKPFWRVVIGPASNASERSALLKNIKDQGFSDAYPVTN